MPQSLRLLLCVVLASSACKKSSSAAHDPPANNDGETLEDPEDPNRAHDVPPGNLNFPSAPALGNVQVQAGRDSAQLTIPAFNGAKDYRAFRLPAGTTLELGPNGEERVNGSSLYCAGQRQHNAPALAQPEVLTQLQINDVPVPTTVVVEAIDTLCPFPGLFGHHHTDLQAIATQLSPADQVPFSIFSESEIRATYGSMIFNGHAPGSTLAAPAPAVAPRVLARTVLQITPLGNGAPPVSGFFDDFSTNALPTNLGNVATAGRTENGTLLQLPKWTVYSYGCDYCEFSIQRGQLNVVVADYAQNVIASNIAIPRQLAHLNSASYLHVTYQISSNATQRRYWWLSLCGSSQAGQTFGANQMLSSPLIPAPFFDAADGANPSIANWSCLQVFPRDGSPFTLAPGPARPESDVRVMVNAAPDANGNTVHNVSPDQYALGATFPPSWYRQMDAQHNLVAAMLDDQLNIEMQTTFDVYVKNDRVVVYAEGQQRLCNDFPNTPLNMAETVIGFGQILFDSADERIERTSPSNDRTGQLYYTNNAPYADVRSWDNMGFEEQVPSPPAGFDSTLCYVAQ